MVRAVRTEPRQEMTSVHKFGLGSEERFSVVLWPGVEPVAVQRIGQPATNSSPVLAA